MLQGCRIAVVVPAFNEERFIDNALGRVPSYVDMIVVVDDASTDHTAQRVRRMDDTRIVLVQHKRNQGVGAAIVSGYRVAAEADMMLAAVMAGDGQMHPDDLPGLLLPIICGEADYVKGDRLRWPGAEQTIPLLRYVGIRALEVLTRWSTGLHGFGDFQCGYTAIRLSLLENIPLGKVYARYGFPNDILNHLVLADAVIKERVVRPIYDGQDSSLRIHRVITPIAFVLARGTLRRLWHGRPAKQQTQTRPLSTQETHSPSSFESWSTGS